MTPLRDRFAELKILRAMLSLEQFTARELAAAANVSPETARDFVKPARTKWTEVVEAGPSVTGIGRPATHHRLVPEKREEAAALLSSLALERAETLEKVQPYPADASIGLLRVALEAWDGADSGLGTVALRDAYRSEAAHYAKQVRKLLSDRHALSPEAQAKGNELLIAYAARVTKHSAVTKSKIPINKRILATRSRTGLRDLSGLTRPSRIERLLTPLFDQFGTWLVRKANVYQDDLTIVLTASKQLSHAASMLVDQCKHDQLAVLKFDLSDRIERPSGNPSGPRARRGFGLDDRPVAAGWFRCGHARIPKGRGTLAQRL